MLRYFLTCRSLTYAQKMSRSLDSAGIYNNITRTMPKMSAEGCGYAVAVRGNALKKTLDTLKAVGIPAKKVFAVAEDGSFAEADV